MSGDASTFIKSFLKDLKAHKCVISLTRVSWQMQLLTPLWGFFVGSMVKNLPAMWETWVQSLGREDPLEKEMGAHSSILAWRIPWTEQTGGLQSIGSQESQIWLSDKTMFWRYIFQHWAPLVIIQCHAQFSTRYKSMKTQATWATVELWLLSEYRQCIFPHL